MVALKDAAQNAVHFATELLGSDRTKGVRLEEVESSSDAWLLTLSMPPAPELNDVTRAIAAITGPHKREYKVFAVDKETGDVRSMKIRNLGLQSTAVGEY